MILELLDSGAALGHAVCIIGTGPVGLSMGLSLARSGLKVLMLESGGLNDEAQASDLAQTEIADPVSHATSTDSVRRGLGGTSKAWGGGCTPFDPLDFQERAHVPMSGAPVSREDIAPFYAAACEFLGCGGTTFDLPEVSEGGSLRSGQIIRFSAQPDMGRRHRQAIENLRNLTVCLNTTVTRLDLEPGLGGIQAIEARSGGRSVRLESPAVVLACGGLESVRLLLCAQREHPSLLGGEAGPLGRYYMGHLSGAVARIAFKDPGMGRRFGFERNESGAYHRRRITLAPDLLAARRLLNIYFLPNNFPLGDAAMRSGALSALHLALSARHGCVDYMRHYRPGHVRDRFGPRLDLGAHLLNILREPAATATGLLDILRQRLDRAGRPPGFFHATPSGVFALRYHSEQAPNPDSRVTLSNRTDTNGVPLPRVDLRFAESDIASVVTAHHVLNDQLERAGWGRLDWTHDARETVEHVRAQAMDGYHQMGLMRMSLDPRCGVIDSGLAVHGFRNLWVAGTGVLPTGSQAHPTFSAVARALRLAEHLAAPAKPVQRTHSAVTETGRVLCECGSTRAD